MNSFNFERARKPAEKRKRLAGLLAICSAAGVIAIGSTLAANINLNTGHPVEFGQGVSQATACTGTDYLTVTANTGYVNDVGSTDFKLTSFSLSHIPNSCWGKTFLFQAYGSSGPVIAINSTHTSASANYQGEGSSSGDGNISGGTGSNSAGSYGTFTLTLASPVALATNVIKVVVQSNGSTFGIPYEGLVLNLDAAHYSGSGNWLDQSPSGFDGVIYSGVNDGVINWKSDFGGVFESNGVDGEHNHIYIDTGGSLYYHAYSLITISRYLPGGQHARILNADNNWLLGHWSGHANSFYDDRGWVGGSPGGYNEDWAVYAATGDPTSDSHIDSFYINGTLYATSDHGTEGPDNLSALGGGAWANETSHGQIAAILAYDRVLSPKEIKQIFDHFKARFALN